jgi:hypothetical protein
MTCCTHLLADPAALALGVSWSRAQVLDDPLPSVDSVDAECGEDVETGPSSLVAVEHYGEVGRDLGTELSVSVGVEALAGRPVLQLGRPLWVLLAAAELNQGQLSSRVIGYNLQITHQSAQRQV